MVTLVKWWDEGLWRKPGGTVTDYDVDDEPIGCIKSLVVILVSLVVFPLVLLWTWSAVPGEKP